MGMPRALRAGHSTRDRTPTDRHHRDKRRPDRLGRTEAGARCWPAYMRVLFPLIMEPGPIEVTAGSTSDGIRSKATITVTGKTVTTRGEDRKFSDRVYVKVLGSPSA
jgi:hypothetical protein